MLCAKTRREQTCVFVFAIARERETAGSTSGGREEGCDVETEQLAGEEPRRPKRTQQLVDEEEKCKDKFTIVQ